MPTTVRGDRDDRPVELLLRLAERLEQRADEHHHHLAHRDERQQLRRQHRRFPFRTEEQRDEFGHQEDAEHDGTVAAGRHGPARREEPALQALLVVLHARERGQRDLVDDLPDEPDRQLQQPVRERVEGEVGGAQVPADEHVVDVLGEVAQRSRAHEPPRERPQLAHALQRCTHRAASRCTPRGCRCRRGR